MRQLSSARLYRRLGFYAIDVSKPTAEPADKVFSLLPGRWARFMGNAPHRFQWGWIMCQPWNDVPMNMRELVSQQFIVDFDCSKLACQVARHQSYFLDEARPLLA